jgi:hypothetical protein
MTDTVFEKREPPAWVVEQITQAGGLNPFGRPNFRVIWGSNRFHTVGGMFKKIIPVKDDAGIESFIVTQVAEMRQLLKYMPFRWWLERWCGPEVYGDREEWYRNTFDEESQLHVLGDYPTEGDYESVFYLGMCSHMKPGDTDWCMHCQVTCGEYIPLEENIGLLEMQIKALLLSGEVSKDAEKAALFMRENVKRQIRNKIVGERVRNALRPKLVMNPSTLMDDQGRCKVPDAPQVREVPLPHNRIGFSQSNHVLPAKKQQELEEN